MPGSAGFRERRSSRRGRRYRFDKQPANNHRHVNRFDKPKSAGNLRIGPSSGDPAVNLKAMNDAMQCKTTGSGKGG
jgi:hypothetical protein